MIRVIRCYIEPGSYKFFSTVLDDKFAGPNGNWAPQRYPIRHSEGTWCYRNLGFVTEVLVHYGSRGSNGHLRRAMLWKLSPSTSATPHASHCPPLCRRPRLGRLPHLARCRLDGRASLRCPASQPSALGAVLYRSLAAGHQSHPALCYSRDVWLEEREEATRGREDVVWTLVKIRKKKKGRGKRKKNVKKK
jgi:hypothetical protein